MTTLVLRTVSLYGATRTVGAVNFTNHTGSSGLQYLSTALPESITATLSQIKNINVVERGQLTAVVKEIELGQTGLFDEKSVKKTGKILQADVLFIGSYTGNPVEVILSLKAVDVKTGRVLDGKVVKAPLKDLFDSTNQAATSMSAIISGAAIGTLSITTTPDGADIYIDGLPVGKSPIIETKLPEGKHTIKAVKSGFIEAETTITVGKNTRDTWSPYLAESKVRNRTDIGANVYYFIPFNENLKAAPLYAIFLGQSFQRLYMGAEIGYSRIKHDLDISSPFGTLTQERWYDYFLIQGHLTYAPFEINSYLQPYFGIFGGWGYLVDYRKSSTHSDDEEKLSSQHIWSLGPKAGLTIAPFSKVSLFLETRFLFTPQKVERKVYESRGILGGLEEKQTVYYFNAFSIGGGIKLYFN
ncbi:MAG: PEGA domain-containing protein [Spirochaetes bacterium]|nr:PEGA domain-containing protein [Spirochaetota bacterium]